MSDDFQPVTRDDVTDEKLVAGEVRALRTEMRLYFERMLLKLDTFDARIGLLEEHRIDANARLADHEHRIAALEAAVTCKP